MRKCVTTIAMMTAWLGIVATSVSAQSFQTLTVEPLDPSTGQPHGKLTFDHNGLIIDGVNESGQPFGRLVYSGNELSLVGFGDPPKVRLADESGSGVVSFNWLRPDGVQEEIFMIKGAVDTQAPGSPGGQLEFWIKRRLVTNDAAMRLMGVISAAYTDNGEPIVRWHPNTVNNLGNFGSPDYGYVTSLTQLSNLSGPLANVQFEDSLWLTNQNVNLDTTVQATMAVDTVSQLRIQLRRTSSGGTQPYVYVSVDGQPVSGLWGYRPTSTTGEIATGSYSGSGTKTITVYTSAQTGTVEIGSIRGI